MQNNKNENKRRTVLLRTLHGVCLYGTIGCVEVKDSGVPFEPDPLDDASHGLLVILNY